jgi:hypothetical protein
MLEPWAEAVMVVVALVMAGGAGYWLRGAVDEWRLRGVLRRVHETVDAKVAPPELTGVVYGDLVEYGPDDRIFLNAEGGMTVVRSDGTRLDFPDPPVPEGRIYPDVS